MRRLLPLGVVLVGVVLLGLGAACGDAGQPPAAPGAPIDPPKPNDDLAKMMEASPTPTPPAVTAEAAPTASASAPPAVSASAAPTAAPKKGEPKKPAKKAEDVPKKP